MPEASLRDLIDEIRSRLGAYMAPRKSDACVSDPSCMATGRAGAGATVGEIIAQGRQVIVSCACAELLNAPDIWGPIASASPYSLGDYPIPDDSEHPWRTDAEIVAMLDELSHARDLLPRDEMFGLGVQIGLSEDGNMLKRAIYCPTDPLNVNGVCPAVNHDWDQFASLAEVAAFTNPKSIGNLSALRRDRINILTGDHYSPEWTEEIYKLNRGATRVELEITEVVETGRHDSTSDPDYYPVFDYPGSSPLTWSIRPERNLQIPNQSSIYPLWPGWKSYPNDWGTASAGFLIYDADSGATGNDDASNINFFPGQSSTLKINELSITECVLDSGACLGGLNAPPLEDRPLYETKGFGAPSSDVYYHMDTCVWSWQADLIPDPDSLCSESASVANVYNLSRPEGQSGSTVFEFEIRLTAPSLMPVTVKYRTNNLTATAGSDFEAVTDGAVTFAPGETRNVVAVTVFGDGVDEADETFELQLTGGATLGSAAAIGTILNDDFAQLAISNVAHKEGDAGGTPFDFTVTLDPPVDREVSVHYHSSDQTATVGSDYLEVADSVLIFRAGETVKTITVVVLGDTSVEADESFAVHLTSAQGAGIQMDLGIGTILDDDARASITSPLAQVGDEGQPANFAVGTLVDSRATGSWTVNVDWGDGQTDSFTVGKPGSLDRPHAYADNGIYNVTVSAIDANNIPATNTGNFSVTVANVPPTAIFGSALGVEGSPTLVSFADAADSSAVDTQAGLRFAYLCTGAPLTGVTWATASMSPATECTFNDNGSYSVRGAVIDKDGGLNEYSTTVLVENLPPAVGVIELRDSAGNSITDGVASLTRVTLEATFTDAGTLDTHQATIDWGDGSSDAGAVAENGGSGTVSASHSWTVPGRHTVRVSIRDDDADSSFRELTVDVTDNETLCHSLHELEDVLSDVSVKPSLRRGVSHTLDLLRGRRGGRGENGACDRFERGQAVAGVVNLEKSAKWVEKLLRRQVVSGSPIFLTLRQTEEKMALSAKQAYLQLRAATTNQVAQIRAEAMAQRADAALDEGRYHAAIERWLSAVRLLARGHHGTNPSVTAR